MGDQPIEQLTRRVVGAFPQLNDLTDFERTSVRKSSEKLFSVYAIFKANTMLVGNKFRDIESAEKQLVHLWKDLYEALPPWRDVYEKRVDPVYTKDKFIFHHATILRSIAAVLRIANEHNGQDGYRNALSKLKKENWVKSNRLWTGKVLTESGGVINNKTAESVMIQSFSDGMNYSPREK